MSKYHVNANGEAGKCRAQNGNCPFGGASEHFDTVQDAQTAAEKKLEQEFGATSVIAAPVPESGQVKERANLTSTQNEAIDMHRQFIRKNGEREHSVYSLKENSKTLLKKIEWSNNISRYDIQDVSFDAGSLSTGYYILEGDDTKHRFDVSGSPEQPSEEHLMNKYWDLEFADRAKYELYAHVEEGNITPDMYQQTISEVLKYAKDPYSDQSDHHAKLYFRVNAPTGGDEAPYDPDAPEEHHREQASKELKGLFQYKGVSPSAIKNVEFDKHTIHIETENDDVLNGYISDHPHLTKQYLFGKHQ